MVCNSYDFIQIIETILGNKESRKVNIPIWLIYNGKIRNQVVNDKEVIKVVMHNLELLNMVEIQIIEIFKMVVIFS